VHSTVSLCSVSPLLCSSSVFSGVVQLPAVQTIAVEVDQDGVAILDECDRPAEERLRRQMADDEPDESPEKRPSVMSAIVMRLRRQSAVIREVGSSVVTPNWVADARDGASQSATLTWGRYRRARLTNPERGQLNRLSVPTTRRSPSAAPRVLATSKSRIAPSRVLFVSLPSSRIVILVRRLAAHSRKRPANR
jgi:hypothetical protein